MLTLPIDDALPALLDAVAAHGVAVLVAPPGAGKTTRVPSALLDANLVGDGDIVVLQPRRLAARLAAERVAFERGVRIGDEVGYEIRLDRKVSAATRIRFVTEGILTRRLLSDPTLRGTSCVIIDEFHERHLDGDVALALLARLRASRPELRLIVMSATLDAEPVAAFLQAPIVRSMGRTFPLTIEHADPRDDLTLPIGKQVSGAVRKLVRDKLDGDVLVFLPGAGEIRFCTDDLAEAAAQHDLLVVPLHGELTAEEQDRAIGPAKQRKVILATNVAETSVTIDGVVAVIDTGRARVARHSPWSGLPMLQVEPISKASAAQRAGRAGRTRPGRVLRLYTQHDHDGRRDFDAAEIARADLAATALEMRAAGLAGLNALTWFEPPPPAAVAAAELLLRRLGATDEQGHLLPMGRAMLRFATHPRLARLICEAEPRGAGREACLIAACASARELRLERRAFRGGGAKLTSPSDLIDDLDAMLDARASGMRSERIRSAGLDVPTAHTVHRVAQQYERLLDTKQRDRKLSDDELDRVLQMAILAAYPDRVGKRRAPRSADFVFAGGGGATLAPTSSVIDAEYIVAVDTAETGQRGTASKSQIRRASAIDPAWLIDLFLDRIVERDELSWNSERNRVERVTQMMYEGLVIDESRDLEAARNAGSPAAAILAKQALAAGIERFVDAEALTQWRARLATVARATGDESLAASDESLAAILTTACDGYISFDELRRADLMALLDASLGDKRALVARLAPTHIDLPRRRRVQIHYELAQAPWLAARMQDFFGLARAPSVCDGRVPLVLHLLAPNQRPVQVTQDLPGFWVKHYPALRNQLMRRYPRHQWPPDPTQFIADD
ncbi:MAG: ATP-dependent helicase HrpB [Kofleriaceae bacterium]|nr:ATP-dependent helicase HrpB [Kofleriaceae bacterium]